MLKYDAANMARINRLIDARSPEKQERLRRVEVLILRPSRDLGRLAADCEARLPGCFRFLLHGLGTRETKSPDFLSMLMFQEDYLSRLIALGEEDARARGPEIVDFVTKE